MRADRAGKMAGNQEPDGNDDRQWELRRENGTPATGFYATVADTILNDMPRLSAGRRIYIVNNHQRRALPPDEIPRLVAALDIPEGAQLLAYELDGATLFLGGRQLDGTPVAGEDWHGYTLTLIGLATDTPNLDGPVVRLHLDNLDISASVFLQVRCAIVTNDQTRARVDIRWHPERREQISVRGLEHPTLKYGRLSVKSMTDEANKAIRGIALVRKVLSVGRQEGDTFLDDTDPDCIRRAYVALFEQGGNWQSRRGVSHPSQEDVAAYFHVSKPTLQRYLKHHELDWHEIKRAILPQ